MTDTDGKAPALPAIEMGARENLRLVVQLVTLLILVIAVREALGFRDLARYFPVFAGSLGIFACVFGILMDQVRYRKGIPAPKPAIGEATLFAPIESSRWTEWPLVRAARYIGWILALGLLLAQFSITQVGPVYVAVFLFAEAGVRWWRAILYGGLALLLILFLSVQIGIPIP
jgi:hypothetical protein